jgi:BASS family bile acid:Na+ symporter
VSSLAFVGDVAVPVVVWLLMFVVGLDLSPADFRRVFAYPRTVLVATAAQVVLLPLLAAPLIWLLQPPPAIVVGIVLLAGTPGGAISNFYALLARANVALSVTLTAISSLLAVVTMPLLTGVGMALFVDPSLELEVPVARIAGQLLLMLLMPVGCGMLLRHYLPLWVVRHGGLLRAASLGALALLVVLLLAAQHAVVAREMWLVILLALLFSVGAMAIGWVVGHVLGCSADDRFTLVLECTARNLAIAAVVGVAVLGSVDFVFFATVVFLVQVVLVLALVAVRSRLRHASRFGAAAG